MCKIAGHKPGCGTRPTKRCPGRVVEMVDFKTGEKVTGLLCPKCEFPVVGGDADLAEHLRAVCPLRNV